jgi:tetratricopeptide (TPR) repeat protein
LALTLNRTKVKKEIMKILKFMVFALFVGATAMTTTAQTEAELYKLGMKYKKDVDNVKLLQVFKKLVEMKPENADYLAHMSFGYSKVGANLSDEKLQLKYYAKAKEVATKAMKNDPKSAYAHYSFALALARENENAGSKQKIANAKEIKKECEISMKLDPTIAGNYHIMARWHRTFAGFSKMENALVNTLFGGKPEGGTYKDALAMFQKAIELEPWYMLHVYELAVTYKEMKQNDLALKYVEKAMKLSQSYEDAKLCYKQCEELKAELK